MSYQPTEDVKCAIVGEHQLASLMVRYWGIGSELSSDEREILLFGLNPQSEHLGGSIYKEAKILLKQKLGSGPKLDPGASDAKAH